VHALCKHSVSSTHALYDFYFCCAFAAAFSAAHFLQSALCPFQAASWHCLLQ